MQRLDNGELSYELPTPATYILFDGEREDDTTQFTVWCGTCPTEERKSVAALRLILDFLRYHGKPADLRLTGKEFDSVSRRDRERNKL